jgi:hypothetical protein
MIDVSGWKTIGKSDNANFYEIEPGVLAVVPHDGATDTEKTATQSVQVQLDYLRPTGQRASVLVFMDPVLEQLAEARKVYRDMPDPALINCYALIGGSAFGRAVGSIFIGLSPPAVPTKLFGSYEEALGWARTSRRAA